MSFGDTDGNGKLTLGILPLLRCRTRLILRIGNVNLGIRFQPRREYSGRLVESVPD